MQATNTRRWKMLAGLGAGIALTAAAGIPQLPLFAQDPPRQEQELSETMKKTGKIESIVKNDRGDVDGFKLDNDLHVHFPPHMAKKILAIAKLGDAVTVEGRNETKPRGEKVFEISKIQVGEETVQVEPPRGKRGPRPEDEDQPMQAKGKVSEYATNPHGEVDGLVLEDGTIVKFPPHQSKELQAAVPLGSLVKIDGRRHETPHGEIHLHADSIESKGKTLEREGPKPGPHGAGRGPGKGPAHGPEHLAPHEQNAEMLRELREIRKLLEQLVQK